MGKSVFDRFPEFLLDKPLFAPRERGSIREVWMRSVQARVPMGNSPDWSCRNIALCEGPFQAASSRVEDIPSPHLVQPNCIFSNGKGWQNFHSVSPQLPQFL